MVSKEPTVSIVCCIFADGGRIFTLDDKASINTARQKWLDSRSPETAAQHRKHETVGGAIKLKMLVDDWLTIEKEQLR